MVQVVCLGGYAHYSFQRQRRRSYHGHQTRARKQTTASCTAPPSPLPAAVLFSALFGLTTLARAYCAGRRRAGPARPFHAAQCTHTTSGAFAPPLRPAHQSSIILASDPLWIKQRLPPLQLTSSRPARFVVLLYAILPSSRTGTDAAGASARVCSSHSTYRAPRPYYIKSSLPSLLTCS
jgi:hypothetical protein